MQPAATAPTTAPNGRAASVRAAARAMLAARVDELDEFRRVDYSAGWDDDDALLGWVDDDVVQGGRKLH